MRTRKGVCYPRVTNLKMEVRCAKPRRDLDDSKSSTRKRTKRGDSGEYSVCRKKTKRSPENSGIGGTDFFDALPDDLVASILCKLGSSASCPADFAGVLITCKRFYGLGRQPIVLAKVSPRALAVKAESWSEHAHRFLKICADAGNVEACYTLGMIRFYCLQSRGSGASLMAKAAIRSHAQALYSLAVIQFNGSGGLKSDKDLRAGVALCARAAFLGHIDALRELGHCLQDGYGVRQNTTEGRRFLVQANARELAAVLSSNPSALSDAAKTWLTSNPHRHIAITGEGAASAGCPLMSDFGCNVPAPEAHPASRFLTEWFAIRGENCSGLRLCSHALCGRPETRRHEFRRCSVCGKVNYCSRACQALDWKLRHKVECARAERWLVDVDGEIPGGDAMAVDGGEVAAGES